MQVFQRRIGGSVGFDRTWATYEKGFGVVSGEFWLGNEKLHWLTSSGDNVLRIDLEAFDGETRFAVYTDFLIEDASRNYALRLKEMVATSDAGRFDRTVMCEARINERVNICTNDDLLITPPTEIQIERVIHLRNDQVLYKYFVTILNQVLCVLVV